MQRLHDVEETEHAKAAKLEQAAEGPILAWSGAGILLPKGIAGARMQPVTESRKQLARRRYRVCEKTRRQYLSVGRHGTKTGQCEECLRETRGVACALLSALNGFRGNHSNSRLKSESIAAAFSGADANDIDHMTDKDLSIPGLTRARSGLNRLDNGLH